MSTFNPFRIKINREGENKKEKSKNNNILKQTPFKMLEF